VAVTSAHALSFVVRALVGKPADHITLLMATILPIVIAVPISLYVFRQTEKLDRAYAALLLANDALARKASRDQMTGLLNRESFMAQIDVLRLVPAGGALLMVDVDHFKQINDRYGHPVGDEALVRIAAVIKAATRRDDLVGRIGGEEFGAFLVGADVEEAQRVGQRLRQAVETLDFQVAGKRVALSVSVGGAVAKGEAALADLVRKTDGLLYQAKNAGRNKVIIESPLTFAA
jgi:diguanylate cyclase (GGDEF)-like protein